jgi:hypothetical protein
VSLPSPYSLDSKPFPFVNRLKDFLDPLPEPEGQDDYFIIESHYDIFAVTRQTADEVVRQLELRARWLTFRDLSASWHRIIAAHVYRISESTVAQRAASREFWRARKLEAKADRRPWEDDD